ncbi:MAG: hypothetical protein SGPRY_007405 [Prymnesium sp.]
MRALSAPPRKREEPPSRKEPKKEPPAWAQSPFQKQITRNQALIGKLLEDNTLVRVLRGAQTGVEVYDPAKYGSLSHHLNTSGHVRQFGSVVGRIDLSKAGSRSAAAGAKPSMWFPTAPAKDDLTRPASASSGIAFDKQITRKQDVNGKLLEDNTMALFLFGSAGKGPEYYEKAHDTLTKPLNVSHRPRPGTGQQTFSKQIGRLPFNRAGSRAASEGCCTSYWEPGMAYTTQGKNNAACLLAQGPSSFGNKRQGRGLSDRPIAEAAPKHIYTLAWDKAQTREKWIAQPLRIQG